MGVISTLRLLGLFVSYGAFYGALIAIGLYAALWVFIQFMGVAVWLLTL